MYFILLWYIYIYIYICFSFFLQVFGIPPETSPDETVRPEPPPRQAVSFSQGNRNQEGNGILKIEKPKKL